MSTLQVFYIAIVAALMITTSMAQEDDYRNNNLEHYAYPKYKFEYQVNDEHTKDIKSQHETRDGNHVSGFYSLLQPDGKTRTVQYSADEKTGFQAVVNYEGGSEENNIPHHSTGPEPIRRFEEPSARESNILRRSYSKSSLKTPHFYYSF